MLANIQRILGDARPIDAVMLVIEFLVLLLIAYEVWVGIRSKQKTRRRVGAIYRCLSAGQDLQWNAPAAGTTDASVVTAWVQSVKTWMNDTYTLLGRYSAQAAASFVHDSGGASVQYNGISGLEHARDWYRTLLSRLDNLRGIMEKPDVYF